MALMAVQLMAGARDAWLQLTRNPTDSATEWSAVAHGATVVAGAFLLFFVADILRQGSPNEIEADVARAVKRQAQFALGVIALLGAWLLWDLLGHAPTEVVSRDIQRLIEGPFSVSLAILCTIPLALLRALWSRTPRTHARWVLWLPDGDRPLTTLPLRGSAPLPPTTLSMADFRAVLCLAPLSLLMLLVSTLSVSRAWTPATVGLLTVGRIGLLAGAIAITYVVARYLFLEVVLRRVLVSVTLATVVGGGVFLMVDAPSARQAQLASIAILVVWSSLAGCEWLQRRLSGWWGLLPEQPLRLAELLAAMARCTDAQTLTATMTQGGRCQDGGVELHLSCARPTAHGYGARWPATNLALQHVESADLRNPS
jgi:hypothetical protein